MPPPNGPPPADPGNQLLAKVPVTMAGGLVDTPEGQCAVLTFRTASTTFTVLVTAAEFDEWIASQQALRSTMTSSGLTVVTARQPLARPGT